MADDDRGHDIGKLMRDPAEDEALGIIDIGHDMRIMFTERHGARVGLIESHRTPEGRECYGAVTFDVPQAEGLKGPRWTVESWEPLTISPSVLCSCGHHGFIRAGAWVPA